MSASHVTTVMISCAARTVARSITIPQFEAHGLTPHVILSPCDPPGPPQNNAAGYEALIFATNTNREWVLFLEDDIDVCPNFSPALTEVMRAGFPVVYLYLNDRADRGERQYGKDVWAEILSGRPMNPRVIPAQNIGQLYGSQAVLMTCDAARAALRTLGAARSATDTSFIYAWRAARYRVGIRVPHLVQHRHDRTLRKPEVRGPKRSMSYGRSYP